MRKELLPREDHAHGEQILNKTVYIVNAGGVRVPISISTALLKDGQGAVMGAVETFRDLSVEERLRKTLTETYSFEDILSKNHRMQALFQILPDVAQSQSTVLIEGGKRYGKRAFRPGHPPPESSEGQTFYRRQLRRPTRYPSRIGTLRLQGRGLHGCQTGQAGAVQVAERGVLFLDEIGDISPAMQVRLLRVLQERTYEPWEPWKP